MSTSYLVIFSVVIAFLLFISFLFIYSDFLFSITVKILKEKRTKHKLKKFAIDHDFPLLSDVVFEVKKEVFTTIDHVMIGDKYIYVITNKCWYGYLNGKAKDDKWILYRKDKLKHVSNPLIANRSKVRHLAALLETRPEDFVNIVYLSKPVVVKKIESNREKEFVLFETEFEKFIEVYEKECKLNAFAIKSIEKSAKSIFDYHKKSLISFKQVVAKESANAKSKS